MSPKLFKLFFYLLCSLWLNIVGFLPQDQKLCELKVECSGWKILPEYRSICVGV